MARFAFLGSSGAVPSAERDTTSLVVEHAGQLVLFDCGGSPVQRLRRLGLDPLRLAAVAVTHLHADHAYGLPALVQSLVILGRREPLTVVCRPEHAEALYELLTLFNLLGRERSLAVPLQPIDLVPGARALSLSGLTLATASNAHGSMPNFAVRADVGGRSLVYSSDTEPCDAVVDLARGADTLVHEATFPERDRGRFGTHSTAAEAGAVAARAGVRRLILAHVEADYHGEVAAMAAEARRRFAGVVEVARELTFYEI